MIHFISSQDFSLDAGPQISAPLQLDLAFENVRRQLRELVASERWMEVLERSLGSGFSRLLARELAEQWGRKDFSALPRIQLRDRREIAGADGAFAVVKGEASIFLAREFVGVHPEHSERIAAVLLEEIGHFLDAELNLAEAPGDEGALFSALVRGEELDEATMLRVRSEDDQAWAQIDGERVLVECSTEILQAQITALKSGVEQALERFDQAMALKVYAESIPLFGDELKTAFDDALNAANPALKNLMTLRNTLSSVLGSLTNATYSEGAVETAINGALASAGFTGSVVNAVLSGDDVTLEFNTDRSYSTSLGLESNFGLPGLDLQTSGSASASLAFNFDFAVGVDGALGSQEFFVNTNTSNFTLGLNAGLSGFTSGATALGFLNLNAIDNVATPTTFTSSFAIDLKDANNDGKLRLSELTGNVLDATFSATAGVHLKLAANMGAAVLPSVSADLNVGWSFSNSLVNPGDDNSSFGGPPTVSFDNVKMDFGSFVESYVRPILDKLDPILDPINDTIAVLRTPLGFLQNLPGALAALDKAGTDNGGLDAPDGQITMLDLIKVGMVASGNNTPLVSAVQFINLVDDIVDWAAFFQGKDFGADQYNLGSFDLGGFDIRQAGFDLSTITPNITAAAANLDNFFDTVTGAGFSATDPGSGMNGRAILDEMIFGSNFAFPILTDPTSIFKLFTGGQATLFGLDLPSLSLGFGSIAANGTPTSTVTLASIPVFPGINVTANGAFQVAMDLAFGFDTRGLQQFASSGFTDFSKILNGLFIDDQFSGGIDRPEITLAASISLGVEASIYVASIGAQGNLTGQLFLNLNDVVNGSPLDHRLYLDEMGNALTTNPFGIFDTSGRISGGLTAYARAIGFDIWRYNSPRVTFVNFGDNPQASGTSGGTPPPPPGLADNLGGVLRLNVGPNSGERDISDKVDDGETIEVSVSTGNFTVFGFGRSEVFTGISGINGAGGAGGDELVINDNVNLSATLAGGEGDDYIHGGGAADSLSGDAGRDVLEGRAGSDTLRGGEGDDLLDGGAGADLLDGGNGFDIVTYDGAGSAVIINLASPEGNGGEAFGDTLVGVEMVEGSSHGDTLIGDASGNILAGLAGNDSIDGGDGNDVILAGPGADHIDGNSGYDSASYVTSGAAVTVNLATGLGSGLLGSDAQGDTLLGIEQVEGSFYADAITGDGANNTLIGGPGADTLDGGDGFDSAWYVTAPSGVIVSMLTTAGSSGDASGDVLVNIEQIEGSDFSDRLSGNSLDNTLLGVKGHDSLYGNDGNDYLLGDAADSVELGNDSLSGGAGSDTLVGGLGADSLDGGDGIDTARYVQSDAAVFVDLANGTGSGGHADDDTFTGIEIVEGSNYDDTVLGGGGAETFWGFGGADSLEGGAGADLLYGGTGQDTLRGGLGIDTLVSGLDGDLLDGGDGVDVVDYSGAGGQVVVDLSAGLGFFNEASGDVFTKVGGIL